MNEAYAVIAAGMPGPTPPSNALVWVQIILLIMGGILAVSGLIVSKKPNAKQVIDALVPFQALIGVGLLVVAIILLIQVGPVDTFKAAQMGMGGLGLFGIIMAGAVLGFLFGVPQIVKWIPSQSNAETKMMELVQMLSNFQVMIGGIGLAAAAIMILVKLKIIT